MAKIVYARNGQFLVSDKGEAIEVEDLHINTHAFPHPVRAAGYIVKQDMGFSIKTSSPHFKRVCDAARDGGLRDFGFLIASAHSSNDAVRLAAQVRDFVETVFMLTEDFNGKLPEEPDYKQILINLCAGAHLADHMGDMASDIDQALIQAGIITEKEATEFEDLSQLSGFLALEHKATTIWGTELGSDDDGE